MIKSYDNEKYLQLQGEKIIERINKFDNKLYLEFGGKLFDDYHASRVLPGFESDAKTKLLCMLKDKAEIIFCINAADIERNKIRADYGITYDADVMRLIDNLRALGIYVSGIVVTQYKGQPAADVFIKKLQNMGEKTYIHTLTKGYPTDVDVIVSDEGYGANPYIETTRPLVVITAPGPGSGKLATCLSQLYHEYKRGVKAGYAKFETFPIWNISLNHPVNLAYEAATADLHDVNMIDPFHLDAYGVSTVNYNRDVEVFPVVKRILDKITGEECPYKSPTDMGVNMAGNCIVDDEKVREAAKEEIIRRYYKSLCDVKLGRTDIETVKKIEMLMQKVGSSVTDRKTVAAAREKADVTGVPCVALQLKDGRVITGKTTHLMSASCSAVLNAIKELSDLPDSLHLISPIVLEPIMNMKRSVFNIKDPTLNLEEVLIAVNICAATNPTVQLAVSKLSELISCDAHSTVMLRASDEDAFRKLKINITCEPHYATDNLYQK
ncbi:MAG: DUF1846 domain-containing protein [Clostridia bacterium]|nr:DUF1846 domain-containing protein [Clostridia bacterium]